RSTATGPSSRTLPRATCSSTTARLRSTVTVSPEISNTSRWTSAGRWPTTTTGVLTAQPVVLRLTNSLLVSLTNGWGNVTITTNQTVATTGVRSQHSTILEERGRHRHEYAKL